MSKAEILAELPKLLLEERQQVLDRLCELQELDLISGAGPSEAEKQLLDEANAEFEEDRDPGIPWQDAIDEVRSGKL